jgi:hypothetical protein
MEIGKKINFEIWIGIWKKLAVPLEGNEKIEIYHENLNDFFIFLKFENFHFWNLKWKFSFEIWKKLVILLERNEKNLKWRKHIFCLCHSDKTFNNTYTIYNTYVYHPIPHVQVVVVYN